MNGAYGEGMVAVERLIYLMESVGWICAALLAATVVFCLVEKMRGR